MKILFSIIINALILFMLTYMLAANPEKGVLDGISMSGGWKTYLLGGIILGVINITIRPILKILSLPLFFVFFGLVTFLVNGIILKLFEYIINDLLKIPGVSYNIDGWINFAVATTIFTVLNVVYQMFFKK
ncbi:hypothetical protein CSA08_01840 [Candidatus Gracilibacteria bacterium]|nr:MAG: hypothetical protein CSA08_01840 [Candidatus Gracilibacteria bacterium]